jgi:hypothetical protein
LSIQGRFGQHRTSAENTKIAAPVLIVGGRGGSLGRN